MLRILASMTLLAASLAVNPDPPTPPLPPPKYKVSLQR